MERNEMSNKEPRGLGKGLGALLGEDINVDQFRKPVGYVNKEIAGARPRQDSSDVLRIPVERVEANPFQPRMAFDQEALEELAASIRTLGLIQPITVRKLADGRYQIISGERRFKACRMAGMSMIPAYVREADDQGMLEMALVENIQRSDLGAIEVALAYKALIEECRLTHDQLSDRVGKNRSTITNYLRLLELPAETQLALSRNQISMAHARALAGVEDAERHLALLHEVITRQLSVHQTEQLVKSAKTKPAPKVKRRGDLPTSHSEAQQRLKDRLQSTIEIKRSQRGKGSLTIHFNSDSDFERILQIIEN